MAKITAAEREQTKKDIITASESVFRKHGYQKTQIKMIAKKSRRWCEYHIWILPF